MKLSVLVIGLLLVTVGVIGQVGLVPGLPPQAQLIGSNIILQVTNFRVEPTTVTYPATTSLFLKFTIKNTATSAQQFLHLLRVASADDKIANIPCSGSLSPLPLLFISDTLAAGEQRDETIAIGSPLYQPSRIYEACMDDWQLDSSAPSSCTTDPYGFACTYIQLSIGSVSNQFIVNNLPQATVNVFACNTVTFSAPFASCVTLNVGTVNPTVGPHQYQDGQSITFTATPTSTPAPGNTFKQWMYGNPLNPAQISTSTSITKNVQNNDVAIAIFEPVVIPPTTKIHLTVTQTNNYGTTTPAPGVYEKNVGEQVTVTMTPLANQTMLGSSSIRIFTVVGYSVQVFNDPLSGQFIAFPNDNVLVSGSKTPKSFTFTTTDADALITVSYSYSDVICQVGITCQAPPGGTPGFTGPVPWWVAIAAGIAVSVGSVIMPGRRKM